MSRRILVLSILVLSYSLAICQSSAAKKPVPVNNIKGNMMRTLYHNYNVKTKMSTWFCTDGGLLKTFSLPTPTQFAVKMLYADSVTNGAKKQLYLLLSVKPSIDEDCHGCAPVLKFLVFDKFGHGWKQVHQDITDRIGSYGEAPDLQVKKIGKATGFIFTPGFTNMGETTEGIVIYAYYKNAFRQILSISESSDTNDGNCEDNVPNSCYSYTGKISFLETGKDFNDIRFVKKGTVKPNDKVIKIDSVITYRFTNGLYVKVK